MSRTPTSRRTWLLPLLVCGVYVLLQLAAGPSWTLFPDSYRYARAAEQYLGASRSEAHHTALEAFCTSRSTAAAESKALDPLPEPAAADAASCLKRWADAPDITTDDARYQSVFSSRPGYPLLAAPFVGLFGVLTGMRVLGLLMALAGSLVVAGILRSAGLSPPAAAVGQTVFLICPLGWWSTQALGEGLVTVCVLGAVWGGLLMTRGRPLSGSLLFTGALAACTVTRYSTALVLAALIAAAALLTWCFRRSRGVLLLGATAAACAAAIALVMKLLALPSSEVTLQDTFTRHFRSPEVPDPWARLVDLDLHFWRHWLSEQTAMPFFLVLTALALWMLLRYGGVLGPLACAVALVGAVQVAAHPLVQEADRLGVLMWVPVTLGIALLTPSLPGFRSLPFDRTVQVPDPTMEPHHADTTASR
ncbi:hypothetical protein [Streptomyces beijiangensis]|uniref:Uncharacterized protein n=1 Tax=Streptomyces beijiangensis TaxID=163361 RepID=A0A939F5V0_9ACTN|nr:hypothetical protein [Streptomyces beijiangensis]MBO0513141.1 hypothetical protein [Streptomyces beijiangensis]